MSLRGRLNRLERRAPAPRVSCSACGRSPDPRTRRSVLTTCTFEAAGETWEPAPPAWCESCAGPVDAAGTIQKWIICLPEPIEDPPFPEEILELERIEEQAREEALRRRQDALGLPHGERERPKADTDTGGTITLQDHDEPPTPPRWSAGRPRPKR